MKKLVFFLFAILFFSCSSLEEEVVLPEESSTRRMSVSEASEPSPDPFSLDIMRQAVDSVAFQNRSRTVAVHGSQIEATHRYVRFSPATEKQFDALFDQNDFTCYNFPLDKLSPETEQGNNHIAADTLEQLYAVIPVTVQLPDTIAWQQLKEFFDPAASQPGQSDPTWADRVIVQARAIVDDDRHPGDVLPWYPSGEVKAFDDVFGGYVPIEGVTISIVDPSNIMNIIRVKTGKDGRFKSAISFRADVKVNYSLSWDDNGWAIKNTRTSSASMVQYNMSGAWNLQIMSNPNLAHATIFRAAYRYWYKMPAYGLTPPNFGRKLRILNYNAEPTDKSGTFTSEPDFSKDQPDIEICGIQYTQNLFATVAHELGHAAHFSYNQPYYHKVNKFIRDSWAQFTQYLLLQQEYKDLGRDCIDVLHGGYTVVGGKKYENPDFDYNQQSWYLDNNRTRHRIYSPLFIDLYDDFNQYKWYSVIHPSVKMNPLLHVIPDDDICIPNAREIQEIAFGSKDSREAGGWIIQYAGRHGYTSETINRFWRVYSMIKNEDSY